MFINEYRTKSEDRIQIGGSPEEFEEAGIAGWMTDEWGVERFRNRRGEDRVSIRGEKEKLKEAVGLARAYMEKGDLRPLRLFFVEEEEVDGVSVEFILAAIVSLEGKKVRRRTLTDVWGISTPSTDVIFGKMIQDGWLSMEGVVLFYATKEIEAILEMRKVR